MIIPWETEMLSKFILPTAMLTWLMCGLIGAGFYNAGLIQIDPYCKSSTRSDSRMDRAFSVVMIVAGPAFLIAGLIISDLGSTGWTLSGNHCP